MISYSDKFKTGYKVIDSVVEENWELVSNYVERVKESLKYKNQLENSERKLEGKDPIPFKFDSLDEEYTALYCVSDLVKALAKFVRKDDKLVRSTMSVNKGLIDGNIVILRDGEEYQIDTHSIYASGDIQRLHIRYLVNSKLPRITGKSEAEKTLNDEIKKMSKVEKLQADVKRIEKYIKRIESDIEKIESLLLDDIINDNKERYKFNSDGYVSDDKPGFMMKNLDTYNEWINGISKRDFDNQHDRIPTFKNQLKKALKDLEKSKSKLDKFKQENNIV